MADNFNNLSQDEKVAELKYRLGKLVFLNLLEKGYINKTQFKKLRDRLIEELKPIIGDLERGAPWVKNEFEK